MDNYELKKYKQISLQFCHFFNTKQDRKNLIFTLMGNKVLRKQIPTLAYCVYFMDLFQEPLVLSKQNQLYYWMASNEGHDRPLSIRDTYI